jgi:ribonuclease T2
MAALAKYGNSLACAWTSPLAAVLALLLALTCAKVGASEAVTGSFVASRGCDAYLSFRKGTNPGAIRVAPGAEYEVREVNDRDRTWLRVEVPGIEEPLRWVASECGITRNLQGTVAGSAAPAAGGQCSVARQFDSFVLAVSWQPGFCEHVRYNGTKPECDHMADRRLVVSNLTLHGLWPNLQACGTNYGSCSNAEPNLSEETVSYISPWMPNSSTKRSSARTSGRNTVPVRAWRVTHTSAEPSTP